MFVEKIFEMIKLQQGVEGCVFNGVGFCVSQQEHLASCYFFLRTTLLPGNRTQASHREIFT